MARTPIAGRDDSGSERETSVMEVTASLARIRVSPRKARLVVDLIRGKRVLDAQRIMRFVPNKTAFEVERLLKSVAANAENNYDLDPEDLWIKVIYVDDGPTMRRFRPKARGRVGRIQKRSSKITVIAEDRGAR
jgi:large subunit ribosomal protein L22